MKTILLAPTKFEADIFRENAGLSTAQCVAISHPEVLQGVKFSEDDIIFEWPDFREKHSMATEIIDALKRCIVLGDNAGPEWVSSTVLKAT